jgi:hypothetical protein
MAVLKAKPATAAKPPASKSALFMAALKANKSGKAPKPAKTGKVGAAAAPAPAPVGSGPGVIQALIAKLKDGGGTHAELYEHLAALFPARASAKGGMRTTVAIQLKRLVKDGKLAITSKEIDGRGVVFQAAE